MINRRVLIVIVLSISIVILPYIIGGLILAIGMASGSTNIEFIQIYSPNETYCIIGEEYDLGATGGGIELILYKVDKDKNKSFERILYKGRWSERPQIKWVDEENIEIYGKMLNIQEDSIWDNYNTWEYWSPYGNYCITYTEPPQFIHSNAEIYLFEVKSDGIKSFNTQVYVGKVNEKLDIEWISEYIFAINGQYFDIRSGVSDEIEWDNPL